MISQSMFKELWEHRLESQKNRKRLLETEIKKTEKKIEQLLDRIVDADSATVIKAYDETFRTSMEFLSNPCKLWASERFDDKRAVLKLTFSDRLAYVRNEGFRTAKTSLPFSMLGDVLEGKKEMVPRAGIEPARPKSLRTHGELRVINSIR
jgi:site-specific DNA recombinase